MVQIQSKTARFLLLALRAAGTLAVFGVAAKLSYSHVIHFFEWIGMQREDALLMPWSVDGLLVVCSITHILFSRSLTRKAAFWIALGRYSGIVMTLAANVLSAKFVGAWWMILLVVFGYAVAPYAMFVTMEASLQSAAGGSTPARRSASATRGAQTKARKAATKPQVPFAPASGVNNVTPPPRKRVTPKTAAVANTVQPPVSVN